jgi:hypothetical protein
MLISRYIMKVVKVVVKVRWISRERRFQNALFAKHGRETFFCDRLCRE